MTMRYLLDTDICIYIAKEHPEQVLRHFEKLSVGQVGMSLITHGELLFGAIKSHHTKKNLSKIEALAELIPPIALPENIGLYYGEIRYALEKKGKTIGNNDLWIAAHAVAENLILVTNNTKEFSRISHLKIENWVNK